MNLIAHGQPSTSTDSVTISRDQQRKCIVWYKENALKDSIIFNDKRHISVLKMYIDESNETISKLNSKWQETSDSLDKMKKKRKRAFFIGGGIVAILETAILLVVLK